MIRTFEDLECWQACKKLRLFIDKNQLKEGRDLVNDTVKLLNGYMNYLKKAGKGSSVHEYVSPFPVRLEAINYQPKTSNEQLINHQPKTNNERPSTRNHQPETNQLTTIEANLTR